MTYYVKHENTTAVANLLVNYESKKCPLSALLAEITFVLKGSRSKQVHRMLK